MWSLLTEKKKKGKHTDQQSPFKTFMPDCVTELKYSTQHLSLHALPTGPSWLVRWLVQPSLTAHPAHEGLWSYLAGLSISSSFTEKILPCEYVLTIYRGTHGSTAPSAEAGMLAMLCVTSSLVLQSLCFGTWAGNGSIAGVLFLQHFRNTFNF